MRKTKQSVLYGKEEYISTHTREEAMREFGVDYLTLNNFCYRNKIKPIALRKRREIPAGFADYAKEHTLSEIASHFNIPYGTASKWCRDVKVDYVHIRTYTGYTDDGKVHSVKRCGLAQDMIRELSKTFTHASIASVFGYSKERVRQICSEVKGESDGIIR